MNPITRYLFLFGCGFGVFIFDGLIVIMEKVIVVGLVGLLVVAIACYNLMQGTSNEDFAREVTQTSSEEYLTVAELLEMNVIGKVKLGGAVLSVDGARQVFLFSSGGKNLSVDYIHSADFKKGQELLVWGELRDDGIFYAEEVELSK